MKKEEVIVVNEKDEVVGYKKREEITKEEIYRVSGLWIQNSEGKILLAKRASNKRKDPKKWGPAVAGTNEKNETYESNIIKEIEEEIGIKNIQLVKLTKKVPTKEINYFCQWFIAIVDKEIKEFEIQKEEVAEVHWFSKEEIIRELEDNPDKFILSWSKYPERLLDLLEEVKL